MQRLPIPGQLDGGWYVIRPPNLACVHWLLKPVRKFWNDAALFAGVVRLSWTLQGEHHDRLLRIAHVWTRQKRRWRLAYTQLTRIPEQ